MKKKLLPLLCIQFILITSVKSQGLTLPYATGFDSPAEKAGWNIYRTGVLSQYSWGYSGGGFSGQCVSHDYNVGGASTDTVVDWFVSPAMNFSSTGTVALKVNTSGFSTPFPDNFEVLFSSTNQDPLLGNFTVIGSLSYMQPQFQWLDTIITVPFVADSAFIALKYKTIGAAWSTYSADNILISLDPVGISNGPKKSTSLNCSPNPFTSSAVIAIPDLYSGKIGKLVFTDQLGRCVKKVGSSGLSSVNINREGLKAGLYFLFYETGESRSEISRIVILD